MCIPTYERAATVARWFDLDMSPQRPRTTVASPPRPAARQIILITGPSGAGKTSLLRRYRRRLHGQWIDLGRLRLPARPVIELFPAISLEGALALLSRVGLAEAHTYLLPPAKLSTGQQWRLRLAMGIYLGQDAQAACLGCDEFGAVLDSVTAAVAAHALRRCVDSIDNLCAIVATCREGIERALRPDVVIECDFGDIRVVYR